MHPSFTFHVLRLDPLMISHPPTQFPGSATAYCNAGTERRSGHPDREEETESSAGCIQLVPAMLRSSI